MQQYLPLILFCFSSSITPGPNNLMIMMSGLNYGIRRSLPHYWGICLGFMFMLIVVGLGINNLFLLFPSLHKIVQIGGIAYIVYLAIKTIFASTTIEAVAARRPLSFFQAALFQWANPKAWMMAVGIFAAFQLSGDKMLLQVMLVAVCATIILLPCLAVWLTGGMVMRSLLSTPRRIRVFNLVMGVLLLASIGLMIV